MHSRQHAAAPTREVEGAALAEETDAGSQVAGLGQLLPAGLGVVAVLPSVKVPNLRQQRFDYGGAASALTARSAVGEHSRCRGGRPYINRPPGAARAQVRGSLLSR